MAKTQGNGLASEILRPYSGIYCPTRDELRMIRIPVAKELSCKYTPVGHYELTEKILLIAQDVIKDFIFVGDHYVISRSGRHLFGYLMFKKTNKEIGISIAFRNSYDDSFGISLAVGASILSSQNVALPGEMTSIRKPFKKSSATLDNVIVATIFKDWANYKKVISDFRRLKKIRVSYLEILYYMATLRELSIISPRQFEALKKELIELMSSYSTPINMWFVINMLLRVFKISRPDKAMDRYIRAYQFLVNNVPRK